MPVHDCVLEFACFRCRMEGLCRFGFCKAAGLGRPTCLRFACYIPLDMSGLSACCMLICLCMLTQLLLDAAHCLHKTPSFFAGLCALQACFSCYEIERIACCRNACPLLPVLQAVRWCHRLDPRLPCKMMAPLPKLKSYVCPGEGHG